MPSIGGRRGRAPVASASAVEGDRRAVGEATRSPSRRSIADRLGAEAEVDRVLGVERLRPERQEVVLRVLEEGLRQRRPLIGDVASRR